MPSEKKVAKFKVGVVPGRVVERLRNALRELYGVNPEEYITSGLRYTCLGRDLCIIYGTRYSPSKLFVLYEDSWIALYAKNTLTPSLCLIREIYEKHGMKAAIVVAEKGVRAFLYGNDILPQSVVEIMPPELGLYAVIDSSDMEVIGFAKWDGRRQVYENIYDAGIFLRALG
ncbi:MAG: hypothetical protein QXS34_05135 [Desulfurococcaceae archaeon]